MSLSSNGYMIVKILKVVTLKDVGYCWHASSLSIHFHTTTEFLKVDRAKFWWSDHSTVLMFSSNMHNPIHKKLRCKLISLFLVKHTTWRMWRRHLGSSCSYFTTRSRSACSSTATDVYFTESDVRAMSSVVMRVVVKTFPWQPHRMIQALDRFSSRRLELLLATSWLAQRWMFWRRWSLSSSASWYAGVFLQLPTYWIFLGSACTPITSNNYSVFIWIAVLWVSVHSIFGIAIIM